MVSLAIIKNQPDRRCFHSESTLIQERIMPTPEHISLVLVLDYMEIIRIKG